MRGAEVLVRMLLEYKVEVIFGVPGDTSLTLYEAIHDALPKIRHVMARDERSAGFMADAYARISCKPGICECPSVPERSTPYLVWPKPMLHRSP